MARAIASAGGRNPGAGDSPAATFNPQSGESAVPAGLAAATGYAHAPHADGARAIGLASAGFTTGPSTNAALAGLALATRAGGAAGMMAPGPAQPAREMRFRAPPAPAGFPLISVPARATAIRFPDEMFAVAGAAFTAVPPIIPGLETVPEAAVDSGGGTPGGTQ